MECYIYRKKLTEKVAKYKNGKKIKNHSHFTGKYSTCNLRFNMPNQIPKFSQNGSNYDHYFIIFINEGQFECLGGNTEKMVMKMLQL